MSSSSDSKLTHLVRKFLSFSVDSEPNADHIVHCLRAQHREYQRKDLAKLKKQVAKVLKTLASASEDEGNNTGAALDSKPSGSDKEQLIEDEYDKEAAAHDLGRSNMDSNVGSLNANLIQRYRKLQKGRDDDAAAVAAVSAEAQAADIPADIKFHEAEGRTKKRSREDNVSEQPLIVSKNVKSTKRKKSLSKRHSASLSGLDAYQKGESNRRGGVTVPEAVPRPTERYADLGGMEEVLKQIRQLVEYPLVRPELYRHLGVDPPRGVLLRGPPG
ncbi:MAG: hypothetical protein SGARI_006942 [Bacillariaceae sp.]